MAEVRNHAVLAADRPAPGLDPGEADAAPPPRAAEPPFFSIVTVTKGDPEGLAATVSSALDQSCADFELVIVDGDPTGPEPRIDDPAGRVRLLRGSDGGLYDAMNKGLERCTGRYVIFMNGGDRFAGREVLDAARSAVSDHEGRNSAPPDFVYGDSLEQDAAGTAYEKKAHSHRRLWYGMFTHHQAMFYRRPVIGGLRYRPEYRIAADYAFTAEFLARTGAVLYLDLPVCVFAGGGITSRGAIHVVGMREQWRIGRDILRRTLPQRVLALALHLAKHAVMRSAPSLFRAVRYRPAPHSPGAD